MNLYEEDIENLGELLKMFGYITTLVAESVKNYLKAYGFLMEQESSALVDLASKTYSIMFSTSEYEGVFDHKAKQIIIGSGKRHKGHEIGLLTFTPHLERKSMGSHRGHVLYCKVFFKNVLVTTIYIAAILPERGRYRAYVDPQLDGYFDNGLRDWAYHGVEILTNVMDVYYDEFAG